MKYVLLLKIHAQFHASIDIIDYNPCDKDRSDMK